jgi:ketosteroid isomerase-like protein
MRTRFVILAGLAVALSGLAADDVPAILERQTQEMLDAVSSGSSAVWDRYVDPKAVYTDEEGTVSTKAQLVEQIKPLPQGVSGELKVTGFRAAVFGEFAVATFIADEHEVYHGQKLNSQYRTTETWRKTSDGWRLIGSQTIALRTDPPAVTLSRQQMAEYVGRYAVDPTKVYEIRMKDGGLEGQEAGRPAEVLRAELPDLLFVPGKPRYRKVFQRGPGGHITGFAERREAWDLVWTRMP